MKHFALLALLLASSVYAAPQDVVIAFTSPTTGSPVSGACATATPPTCGIRLFKDTVLVGPITSGQRFTALIPDASPHVLGIETWNNVACGVAGLPACTRVNNTLTLGVPAIPPGAVSIITITAPCATAAPPTCTIVVNPGP